jgi:hypothetical protein
MQTQKGWTAYLSSSSLLTVVQFTLVNRTFTIAFLWWDSPVAGGDGLSLKSEFVDSHHFCLHRSYPSYGSVALTNWTLTHSNRSSLPRGLWRAVVLMWLARLECYTNVPFIYLPHTILSLGAACPNQSSYKYRTSIISFSKQEFLPSQTFLWKKSLQRPRLTGNN